MSTDLQRHARNRGFTLAEVLAALLFMAVLIPVTMHGVSVASRAGIMGQRKAAAARIAERVLDEQIFSNLIGVGTPQGTITEGDITYPWSLKIDPWTIDPQSGLEVITVDVQFDVQGNTYDIAVSTLYDPNAVTTTGPVAATATQ